jgi:hypothetical protein
LSSYLRNSRLAIYHDTNISGETTTHGEANVKHVVSSVAFSEPRVLRLHYSAFSSESSIEQLMELPSVEVVLPVDGLTRKISDKIVLSVASCTLDMSGLCMVGAEDGQHQEYELGTPVSSVVSSAPIEPIGRRMTATSLRYPCWRIGIANHFAIDLQDGSFGSLWRLSAFGDGEGWRPRLELRPSAIQQ